MANQILRIRTPCARSLGVLSLVFCLMSQFRGAVRIGNRWYECIEPEPQPTCPAAFASVTGVAVNHVCVSVMPVGGSDIGEPVVYF